MYSHENGEERVARFTQTSNQYLVRIFLHDGVTLMAISEKIVHNIIMHA